MLLSLFQQIVKLNESGQLHALLNHVEEEMEVTKWDVLGWWKATSVDDAALCVTKGHIVSMIPTARAPLHFSIEERVPVNSQTTARSSLHVNNAGNESDNEQ